MITLGATHSGTNSTCGSDEHLRRSGAPAQLRIAAAQAAPATCHPVPEAVEEQAREDRVVDACAAVSARRERGRTLVRVARQVRQPLRADVPPAHRGVTSSCAGAVALRLC